MCEPERFGQATVRTVFPRQLQQSEMRVAGDMAQKLRLAVDTSGRSGSHAGASRTSRATHFLRQARAATSRRHLYDLSAWTSVIRRSRQTTPVRMAGVPCSAAAWTVAAKVHAIALCLLTTADSIVRRVRSHQAELLASGTDCFMRLRVSAFATRLPCENSCSRRRTPSVGIERSGH
jgi:hypothetical protein